MCFASYVPAPFLQCYITQVFFLHIHSVWKFTQQSINYINFILIKILKLLNSINILPGSNLLLLDFY